jgi:hypothetical protein
MDEVTKGIHKIAPVDLMTDLTAEQKKTENLD